MHFNLETAQFKNIRSFIGAKDFEESRSFYRTLGFKESVLSEKMSLFKVNEHLGFYLQDYYVKDWVNNSMLFVEVADVEQCWNELQSSGLDLTCACQINSHQTV